MVVSGFEDDLYLVNNNVKLDITGIDTSTTNNKIPFAVVISFNNPSTGYKIEDVRYYINLASPIINTDISNGLKAMFHKPDYSKGDEITDKLYSKIEVEIKLEKIDVNTRKITTEETQTFERTFIRGGRKTFEENQIMYNGGVLISQPYRPMWDSFPDAVYYIDNKEIKSTSSTPQGIKGEVILERTCDGVYLTFLNGLGGYSYWYFESVEHNPKSTGLGHMETQTDVKDFGFDYTEGMTLISKVPKRYLPSIKDLIFSPDVWMYNEGDWEKVVLKDNNLKDSNKDKNDKVKIKAERITRYNPSLIW